MVAGLISLATGPIMAQLFEVNSPDQTGQVNFNEVLIYDSLIYVFGNSGFGAVSKNHCQSWTILNIDPITKRNIKFAIMPSKDLLLIGGDGHLIKISKDQGENFTDLFLPDTGAVTGAFTLSDTLLVMIRLKKKMSIWDLKNDTIYNVSFPTKFGKFECVAGSQGEDCALLSGNVEVSGVKTGILIYNFDQNKLTPSIWAKKSLPQPGPLISFSVSPDLKTELYVYNNNSDLHATENYFTPINTLFPETFFLGLLPIKSSVALNKDSRWHVGGEAGGNGFLIQNGRKIQDFPNFSLNMIKLVSKNQNNVIAVGDKGKIFSNFHYFKSTDPSSAIIRNWTVSDPIAQHGISQTVDVSGSEAGVIYKVYAESNGLKYAEFIGDGKKWSFTVKSDISSEEIYRIMAHRENDVVQLIDEAVIVTIPVIGYAISQPIILLGDTARVTLGGSETGEFYYLSDMMMNTIGSEITGTGGPLTFKASPPWSTSYNLYVRDSQTGIKHFIGSSFIKVLKLTEYQTSTKELMIENGDTATLSFFRGDSGVIYQIYNELTNQPESVPVSGKNSALSCLVSPVKSATLYVMAIGFGDTLIFASKIKVTVKPIRNYTFNNPVITLGETAEIIMSGSESDVLYQLYDSLTPIGAALNGNGLPLSFMVAPSVNTTYNMTATNAEMSVPLYNAVTVTVKEEPPLWLSETNEKMVKIYPNPFDNNLKIETNEHQIVCLTDAYGRLLTTINLSPGINMLNIDLASGIYFLKTPNQNKSQKIIKY